MSTINFVFIAWIIVIRILVKNDTNNTIFNRETLLINYMIFFIFYFFFIFAYSKDTSCIYVRTLIKETPYSSIEHREVISGLIGHSLSIYQPTLSCIDYMMRFVSILFLYNSNSYRDVTTFR